MPRRAPYGPLQPADANGLMLPPGFQSREIARANQPVAGYPWHVFPDGQATFPAGDGGWVLVSNSESLAANGAGSSAIRFAPDGTISSAYRILSGTNANCAGGPTPWGTWLSCEEYDGGHVWECDPQGPGQGAIRPAMGTFNHEAVCVDPGARRLYMTEDEGDGGLYRFTPTNYPALGSGRLEIAVRHPTSSTRLRWAVVPDPTGISAPTRSQVAGTKRFNGGEGIWFDSGTVYFATKGDNRVWAYDVRSQILRWIYSHAATPNAPLRGVDNLTVSRAAEVFVCEDGGNMEICVISPAPKRTVAPFLRLTGEAAVGLPDRGNETAGVVFDPSGRRMYFAAQRAYGFGVVYEVTGPFQGASAPPATGGSGPARVASPAAAPTGGGRPEDADAPGLTLDVPRRARLAKLRGRGLRVRVETERDAALVVALRTDALRSQNGKRGSSPRPVTTTLARRRRRASAGSPVELRLRLSRGEAARLRRRGSVPARITVLARDARGRTEVATRALRIVARG